MRYDSQCAGLQTLTSVDIINIDIDMIVIRMLKQDFSIACIVLHVDSCLSGT